MADKPELYDFRLGSGVVRLEEGVGVFRGSIDGDLDSRPAGNEPADTGSGTGVEGEEVATGTGILPLV